LFAKHYNTVINTLLSFMEAAKSAVRVTPTLFGKEFEQESGFKNENLMKHRILLIDLTKDVFLSMKMLLRLFCSFGYRSLLRSTNSWYNWGNSSEELNST